MIQEFKLQDMDTLAERICSLLQHPIITFEGAMGIGKTTLIAAICEHLKAVDTVSSPTFSLINEYKTEEGKSIYHFDCYRIETPEEAYDFGAEEYLDSGSICLIEWAEKMQPLLPSELHHIKIEFVDPATRKVTFK